MATLIEAIILSLHAFYFSGKLQMTHSGFRTDISDSVIHFTKGESVDAALLNLIKIIVDRKLFAGNENNRGGYSCISFTETPVSQLSFGLVSNTGYAPYSPFGIKFSKKWLFNKGARPVIYQPEHEYGELPENLRWRHVKYEPDSCDFTWQREWRLCAAELEFDPECAEIVVPDEKCVAAIYGEHNASQDSWVDVIARVLDRDIAEQYREDFPWRWVNLRCEAY